MGLGTDLTNAQNLKTSLTNDGASSAIIADANKVIVDLQSQVTALTSDLSTATSLKATLASDGANATVLADMTTLINDLTSFLT